MSLPALAGLVVRRYQPRSARGISSAPPALRALAGPSRAFVFRARARDYFLERILEESVGPAAPIPRPWRAVAGGQGVVCFWYP